MPTAIPPSGYSVLMVEDDDADAMLVEEAMASADGAARSIHREPDGVAALARLRDRSAPRPDLIMLDLNMPRMNGHEFLKVVKADDDLKTIPVVVLTTSQAPDDITAAYRDHGNAYVTKPVNLDDFARAVHSIDRFFLDTITLPTP
ncbi:response regulator [Streptodolium elevatio]